jgi:hypothetical protein
MEGRRERVEPLDRAHDLSSLGGEVEAVARGDRSMQQCRPASWPTTTTTRCSPAASRDRTARSTRLSPPAGARPWSHPVTDSSRSDRPAASTTPTRSSRERAGSGWTTSARPANEASG